MGKPTPKHTLVKLNSVPVVGQMGTATGQTRPADKKPKVTTKKGAMLTLNAERGNFKLPKGLIGAKTTAQVQIEGNCVSCLMDTGSQVTTVPQSFYNQNLSQHEIRPLFELLEVEGANGQSVPYLGYIEINVVFPKEFLGAEVEVPTLALVVPDVRTVPQPLVLIGTNTLDLLYELHRDTCPEEYEPSQYGYKAVLKILGLRHRQCKDNRLGLVTSLGKDPQLVPAGQTVVLEGFIDVNSPTTEKSVLLEHPSLSALPG